MAPPPFRFKRFRVEQSGAAHPVGTDGILLGAWADISGCKTVLDIGTGTGLIALMLAQRSESMGDRMVTATGVEIYEPAVACAARNFAATPWASRLRAVHCSIQDFSKKHSGKFDLIVSNPPFFNGGQHAPDPVRRLGRSTATLKPQALLDAVLHLLGPGGRFCTILPPAEGRHFYEQASCRGLYCTRIAEVYTRAGKPLERLLLQLEFDPYKYARSKICIYREKEIFDEGFKQLTGDFYLDF